jgi:hypothetical protein
MKTAALKSTHPLTPSLLPAKGAGPPGEGGLDKDFDKRNSPSFVYLNPDNPIIIQLPTNSPFLVGRGLGG